MKKLIFGYGRTGKAVENLLLKIGVDYSIYDDNFSQNKIKLISNNLVEFDEVIISPGIPPSNPLISEIKKKNIKISSDLDLFERINKTNLVKIGVTGTNGKTSFVNLLTDFLNKNGYSAKACGNIGNSVITLTNEKIDFLVIELSSYQLYYSSNFVLDYSIILNIASDHLDWHKNFDDYVASKAKIFQFTKNERVIFYDKLFSKFTNIDKRNYSEYLNSTFEKINTPYPKELVASLIDIIDFLDLKITNRNSVYKEFLKNLKQIEHRYEKLSFNGNVTFINDSKATNFHAVSNAISRSKNTILILHGLTKNVPFRELKNLDNVKKIIKPNEMNIDLEKFNGKLINYESIDRIKELITSEMEDGDTVLFSCGGASFNDFKNYEERGKFFKNLVKEIEYEA